MVSKQIASLKKMISSQEIFSIKNHSDFNASALEVFNYQAQHCSVYRVYIEMLRISREKVTTVNEIPFLPVEFFKTHKVLSDEKTPGIIFESSGTTGSVAGKHYVADKEIYIQSFTRCIVAQPCSAAQPPETTRWQKRLL